MDTATVHSRGLAGVEAPPVAVEVHLSGGIPGWSLSGLGESAGQHVRERVRSALLNCRFDFPSNRRITVNLAPAETRREGARFDLPVALGILAASGQLPGEELGGLEFIGELALTGELRRVRGALPSALAAADAGRLLVVPDANAVEAAYAGRDNALPAADLLTVCAHLHRRVRLEPARPSPWPDKAPAAEALDLADVRGQAAAKRALEIAAAGGHHLLLVGPPGSGKSMLALRLPGLLPGLDEDEAQCVAAIRSLDGQAFDPRLWRERPFRSPHHTASAAALAGGGRHPRPGEVTLAHAGVLFLDELPEYSRCSLEALREPLASRVITVSRAADRVEYPAAFQLVAAMNPCPCGYRGDPRGRCRCAGEAVRRYLGRLSGPLLDRIDLHVEVQAVEEAALLPETLPEPESEAVRQRVARARARQLARQRCANGELRHRALRRFCPLAPAGRSLLQQAVRRFALSARALDSTLKVARTIADLEQRERIETSDLAEAIGLRQFERLAAMD